MHALAWASLVTPVGPVAVGCTAQAVARIRFGPPPPVPADAAGADSEAQRLAQTAAGQVAEYLAGQRRAFDLPLDWGAVPGEPARRVLGTLASGVDYGQTITYGELAARSGLTGPDLPARTTGQIMSGNPLPLLVPCHRVVASNGLGGYSGGTGIEAKRWLLTLEGVLPPTLDWQPAPLAPDAG